MDALAEFLAVTIAMLTQGALIAALAVLAAVLVIPDSPLVVQCLQHLKRLM